MIIFTPEMKKNIQKLLAEMNTELKVAVKEAEKGGDASGAAGKAIKRIVEACRLKHEAITSFPGIETKPGVDLPFFVLFDLFDDLDQLADKAVALSILLAMGKGRGERGKIRAQLKDLIDQLKTNLLNKFKFADPNAVQIIKNMIEALEKMREALKTRELEDLDEEKKENTLFKVLDAERNLLLAYKKDFFGLFKTVMPLWDVYSWLKEIDSDAEDATGLIGKFGDPDSRLAKAGRSRLHAAIDAKKKLEGLVDKTPTEEQSDEGSKKK